MGSKSSSSTASTSTTQGIEGSNNVQAAGKGASSAADEGAVIGNGGVSRSQFAAGTVVASGGADVQHLTNSFIDTSQFQQSLQTGEGARITINQVSPVARQLAETLRNVSAQKASNVDNSFKAGSSAVAPKQDTINRLALYGAGLFVVYLVARKG